MLSKDETTKEITALRDPFLSLGSGTSTCKQGDYELGCYVSSERVEP